MNRLTPPELRTPAGAELLQFSSTEARVVTCGLAYAISPPPENPNLEAYYQLTETASAARSRLDDMYRFSSRYRELARRFRIVDEEPDVTVPLSPNSLRTVGVAVRLLGTTGLTHARAALPQLGEPADADYRKASRDIEQTSMASFNLFNSLAAIGDTKDGEPWPRWESRYYGATQQTTPRVI